IDRDWRAVYAFTARPENLARWASGLGSGLEKQGEDWRAEGPESPIPLRVSPPDELGVADHLGITAARDEIAGPIRVMANGTVSEVALTLFRQAGMMAEIFTRDAAWVARDLATLKSLLES